MPALSRSLAVAGAVLGLAFVGSTAHASPLPLPPVGHSCGPNRVVTDNHTCSGINKSCTGYDMMIIGRVDHTGHCVFPGINGTTW